MITLPYSQSFVLILGITLINFNPGKGFPVEISVSQTRSVSNANFDGDISPAQLEPNSTLTNGLDAGTTLDKTGIHCLGHPASEISKNNWNNSKDMLPIADKGGVQSISLGVVVLSGIIGLLLVGSTIYCFVPFCCGHKALSQQYCKGAAENPSEADQCLSRSNALSVIAEVDDDDEEGT